MKKKNIFFDNYNAFADLLLNTTLCENVDDYAMVLEDNPFLPSNMMSIYEYHLNRFEKSKLLEKDLFYVFLDIPKYWEVRSWGNNGAIFNNGKRVATIYFKEPKEKRYISSIEWNKENGVVYKRDFYNRYGIVYCSEFLIDNGVSVSKVYYTSEHQEVININLTNGTVTLFENGIVNHVFSSIDDFEKYTFKVILKDCGLGVLTSIKQLQWAIETDKNDVKWSVVLWDIKDIEECQNRQLHYELKSSLHILNNYNTREYQINIAKNEKSTYCTRGYYPKTKGTSDILIYTASDQLHGIQKLVEYLPEFNFHIAANTAMSTKLIELSKYQNVFLYPGIYKSEIRRLYAQCDYYLDINMGREVNNAVIVAHLNNLLVLGFVHTLHNKCYMLEECMFESNEEELMIQKIKLLKNSQEELESLTIKQQEKVRSLNDDICF